MCASVTPPHPPESSTTLSTASFSRPQRATIEATDLEEHGLLDVEAGVPAEPFVERPGSGDVGDPQGDEAQPLIHHGVAASASGQWSTRSG